MYQSTWYVGFAKYGVRIARWESRSGKHHVTLYRDQYGVSYVSHGASGFMGNLTDVDAIAQLERRVNDFQPDALTSPMRRTI